MGICAECIYIGDKKNNPKTHRRFSENFTCTNINNSETDFITGEIVFASCRSKNMFGECEFFDDGKIDERYYAWENSTGDIFFTKSETPSVNDYTFDNNGDECGFVDSVTSYFGWKTQEPADNDVLLTLTVIPNIYDNTFVIKNHTLLKYMAIEDFDDNCITVNKIKYHLSSEDNALSVNNCVRNPDLDYVIKIVADINT